MAGSDMSWWKCAGCTGVYQNPDANGVSYTHACAPVTCATVVRGGVTMLAPLSNLQATDLVNVLRAGAVVQVQVSQLQAGDLRVGDVAVPRANQTPAQTPTAAPVVALPPLTTPV